MAVSVCIFIWTPQHIQARIFQPGGIALSVVFFSHKSLAVQKRIATFADDFQDMKIPGKDRIT